MPETIMGFGTLTPLQKECMRVLANLPDKEQFYLAGGPFTLILCAFVVGIPYSYARLSLTLMRVARREGTQLARIESRITIASQIHTP